MKPVKRSALATYMDSILTDPASAITASSSGRRAGKNTIKSAMLESDVQRAILDWLNLMPGIRAWRRNIGALQASHGAKKRFVRFGTPGMSDIEGIGPEGIHIEIEVKAPGKVPSDVQSAWLEQCRAQGAIAFWADNFEWAAEQLNTAMVEKGLWP